MNPTIPDFLLSVPALYIIALIGMFLHFLKKNIAGETATAIVDYFKNNLKSTIIALFATMIGVTAYLATLKTGQGVDIMAALGCGYTFDSLFNKWDNPEKPQG